MSPFYGTVSPVFTSTSSMLFWLLSHLSQARVLVLPTLWRNWLENSPSLIFCTLSPSSELSSQGPKVSTCTLTHSLPSAYVYHQANKIGTQQERITTKHAVNFVLYCSFLETLGQIFSQGISSLIKLSILLQTFISLDMTEDCKESRDSYHESP